MVDIALLLLFEGSPSPVILSPVVVDPCPLPVGWIPPCMPGATIPKGPCPCLKDDPVPEGDGSEAILDRECPVK